MTKKEDEKSGFNLIEALTNLNDWEFKKDAFYRYIIGLGIEIKSDKEFKKQYEDYYGGKIE